ncbi:hypothetical protein F5884DRAFT_668648 [Xylogone sp. PMI_703]|nr:hypothetical protein F5884DRAFT_668648 [Xylogone sp. PMI_703]
MAQNSTSIRASLACIPCRQQHAKCTGERPICCRCQQDGRQCFYSRSRRGTSVRQKDMSGYHVTTSCTTNVQSLSAYKGALSHNQATAVLSIPSSLALSNEQSDILPLLDSYYKFFHRAHPFATPRDHFLRQISGSQAPSKDVTSVMAYIGSLYCSNNASITLRQLALNKLRAPETPHTGYTVLAFLLAAIVMYGEDDGSQAQNFINQAVSVALEIQMNTRAFAQSELDAVQAECWRRTYWGLFIVETITNDFISQPGSMFYDIEMGVELPCEDAEYESVRTVIPSPRTCLDYEIRELEDESVTFSSFSYLIDLARIAHSFQEGMRRNRNDLQSTVTNTNNMLMNWILHLPEKKRSFDKEKGDLDELMFFAHGYFQSLLLCIHRPLSQLPCDEKEISLLGCILSWGSSSADGMRPSAADWQHTKMVLEAAESAINIYAFPFSITHSPLIVAVVSFSVTTILSAYHRCYSETDQHHARNRVRLGLARLKDLGMIWPASARMSSAIKTAAQAVIKQSRMQRDSIAVRQRSAQASPWLRTDVLSHNMEITGDMSQWVDLEDTEIWEAGNPVQTH